MCAKEGGIQLKDILGLHVSRKFVVGSEAPWLSASLRCTPTCFSRPIRRRSQWQRL